MNIYNFYNKKGWKKNNKYNSVDAELFEDLRSISKEYIAKCRKRINNHIPNKGINILDFASGPIQYEEYMEYSKNFKLRHCVDFSKTAIIEAKKKLGKKGKYYCKDFLKIKFKKNFFDCSISLHTIYHINKNKQKKVINKLINIKSRHLGKDIAGAVEPVRVGDNLRKNFINLEFKNFCITEKGDLRDIVNFTENQENLELTDPQDIPNFDSL